MLLIATLSVYSIHYTDFFFRRSKIINTISKLFILVQHLDVLVAKPLIETKQSSGDRIE